MWSGCVLICGRCDGPGLFAGRQARCHLSGDQIETNNSHVKEPYLKYHDCNAGTAVCLLHVQVRCFVCCVGSDAVERLSGICPAGPWEQQRAQASRCGARVRFWCLECSLFECRQHSSHVRQPSSADPHT